MDFGKVAVEAITLGSSYAIWRNCVRHFSGPRLTLDGLKVMSDFFQRLPPLVHVLVSVIDGRSALDFAGDEVARPKLPNPVHEFILGRPVVSSRAMVRLSPRPAAS
ncbi:MAG: hypothetical protein WCJ64_12900 [Rhodospirillaceae bacterium]